MLKKLITAGALSMAVCGVSFAKNGALDIMEWALQDAAKAGVAYHCAGDSVHATCYFKNVDGFLFQLKDMRADIWLSDNEVKQEVSGNIAANFGEDLNQFIPKSFTCNSVSTLKDLQSNANGTCVIKADVATLHLESNTLVESKSFRYKTMPTLLVQYIAKVDEFSKEYDRIQTKYENDLEALQQEAADTLDDIDADIDMLRVSQRNTQHEYGCGCNSCRSQSQTYAIEKEIDRKQEIKEQIRKSYEDKYDKIQKQYEEEMQNFSDSVVAWLSQYNYTMQEARVYVRANKLAKSAFETFAKEYLAFNENIPLSKDERIERANEKKRITAQYYSSLEASRAGGMTFVEQSPYLAPHLKKSLQKIVSDHAQLLDPNAKKRSVKILITPLDSTAMNLGDEAQKMINAYNKSRGHGLMKTFFDIVNKYEIKSVRVWPENN